MEILGNILTTINSFVWGQFMLMLLVGTGVILTIILRFINIRKLPTAIKLIFKSIKPERERGRHHPLPGSHHRAFRNRRAQETLPELQPQ